MDPNLDFLNLDGLDASQVTQLKDLLHPLNLSPKIEFPWTDSAYEETILIKGNTSSLNVHAPAFETYIPTTNDNVTQGIGINYSLDSYNNNNASNLPDVVPNDSHCYLSREDFNTRQVPIHSNGVEQTNTSFTQHLPYSKPVNGNAYQETYNALITSSTSTFKLNPTVSCFIPQNIRTNNDSKQIATELQSETVQSNDNASQKREIQQLHIEQESMAGRFNVPGFQNGESQVPKFLAESSDKLEMLHKIEKEDIQSTASVSPVLNVVTISSVKSSVNDSKTPLNDSKTPLNDSKTPLNDAKIPVNDAKTPVNDAKTPVNDTSALDSPKIDVKPARRSWAQIVSSGQSPAEKVPHGKPHSMKGSKIKADDKDLENICVDEDKMAIILGKHLHELELDFKPVCLQPRGLINRRNWCYINATLQALLASSPFYTLIRNLPIGPVIERGKSATPVIDSLVKVTYEFSQLESSQEELQAGTPFQPEFMYDMLKDLKSDCLKGQQEDAEEFLSFILNSMHEEMVKVIKNYEKKNCISSENEVKENGDLSDEEEWQVIGSKHKGMVTRKVAEHKTPISDLLGGQIKSLLTTNGNKASASIQPFFTLQLDIQSENVTSVSEALKEMTVKEPIQGYTCAKTKQEVEAYSHIALQKLPPVLILHLKRFVYNKNGGCKKVMKKTDYPLELELNKDLFSTDVKKSLRMRKYKLFAVMYHDGEEAIKGHYISDVYSHGSQTWIRCDDRQITSVTEAQVLSHTPPRVPYLLFYQEM